MQNAPLVSIIIPTFNNSQIICQAIDCSLNQAYETMEIIVIDDGSTDDTQLLLKRKYEGRIIYIRQENKGPGGARNTGIRHASGKYLQFLDADDLLDPDKIRIQVGRLRDITGTALSYCDYVCCDIHNIRVIHENRHVSPVLQKDNPLDDIVKKWETQLSIPIHCFIFDASLFKEKGIAFDENLQANEDWECWMNIFALDPQVDFVDQVLAYYRVGKDSRCTNRLKMRNSWLAAIDKQMQKNRANRDVAEKLAARKKEIKYLYRDAGPLARIMERCHPLFKRLYAKLVPWRIQRVFD